MIYLDYTANTPASKQVLDTFYAVETSYIANANANHQLGRQAKQCMQETLETLSKLMHVSPEEIIFTSGATEANNLAVKGIVQANRHVGKHIISTALEHPSISASLTYLQSIGYEIELCPMGKDGRIDLEELQDLLRDDTVLVAVSAVDSELGVTQPLQEIQAICKQYPGCHLHIDATQAIGKIPYDFTLGDTVSFSPHKFYGLNGSGILLKRKHVKLSPQMHGGSSTTIYRAGTPALSLSAAIVPALQTALSSLQTTNQIVTQRSQECRKQLLCIPEVRINSPENAIPHILNLSIRNIKGKDMQKYLDEKDICVSVKSACSVDLLPSRAVMSLTKDKKRAYESFRISLSHLTTKEEIDTFIQAIQTIIKEKGQING